MAIVRVINDTAKVQKCQKKDNVQRLCVLNLASPIDTPFVFHSD